MGRPVRMKGTVKISGSRMNAPEEATMEAAPDTRVDEVVSSVDVGQEVSLGLNELVSRGEEHSMYRNQSVSWF